jgi:hypothetical protein
MSPSRISDIEDQAEVEAKKAQGKEGQRHMHLVEGSLDRKKSGFQLRFGLFRKEQGFEDKENQQKSHAGRCDPA